MSDQGQLRWLRPVDDTDSWDTDDSTGYDPRNFYTTARNGHDHSERLTLRLPPDAYGRINEYVERRAFPAYASPQDFIRDAVIHRFWQLDAMFGLDVATKEWLATETARADMDTRMKFIDALDAMVTTTEQQFVKIERAQDQKMMREAVERAKDTAESAREPYRTRLYEIVERYEGRMK